MTWIFLIFVTASNTSNQQLVPMQSMQQCHAAIQALRDVQEKRTWRDTSPRIDNAYCIEVVR